jgi:beta-mannosidase
MLKFSLRPHPCVGCTVLASLLCLSAGACAYAQGVDKLSIDSGWQFRQSPEDKASGNGKTPLSEWHAATVPGDVHLDLLRNKLIEDPFYRKNEADLQWIENASWDYRTTIHVTPQTLSHPHEELVFEGLDAACDVTLNGQKLGSPDNMFREWRIDVQGKLKPGENELFIHFPSPIAAAKLVAAQDPWQSKIHTDTKVYVRKAAYEYGWDWGPRFVTSGVWRPVHLDVWNDLRIADIFVEQKDVTKNAAHLDVQTQIIASRSGPAMLTLIYGLGAAATKSVQRVTLNAGTNHLDLPVEVTHPELWYPAGYGAQPIYHFKIEASIGGKPADHAETKAGLRSIVLRRDPDQWGRSFEFDINGIPIFAKGADVIPFDSFPNRVKTQQYRQILQSAKDANMNIVRHWGGGYYETQEFYDICDELGLMVWQDLMFGNDWQPGTYDFKLQIEKEAEYQIQRLRNHPSIVLWSGNNETEIARDWSGRGKLDADVRVRLWEDYLTEFSGILARTAARLDPEVPYWPSSPSGDYEDLSDSYQSGDNHDWSVWHGNADFEEFARRPWRFVSEYGFQSFPEMKTVESFTTPEDRTSIFTPVMLAHQKNSSGNTIIHDYMLRYFGEPKDFASFLYASQVLQAEGIKIGAEGFRRNRPRTMGSIFWQINDCWPVASWSSIDYYGRWKALQYYARRFYTPVLVSPRVDNGTLSVYVVSDKTEAEQAELHLRVMSFDGKIVHEVRQAVTIEALSSRVVMQVPVSTILEKAGGASGLKTVFGVVDLTVNGKAVSTNTVYFVPMKQVKLPETAVSTMLTKTPAGYKLELKSNKLARSAYVSFAKADAQFSDNYFDLLPNEPVVIEIKSEATLDELKSQMKVVSLADAFSTQLVAK